MIESGALPHTPRVYALVSREAVEAVMNQRKKKQC